jgi:hypothetical protein
VNVLVYEDVIIAVADDYEIVENGTKIAGTIYPFGTIETIADQEIIPVKHKLVNGEVVINQDYVNSIEAQIQQAIDEYTLQLLEGGVI